MSLRYAFLQQSLPSFIRGQENFYRNQNEEKPPSIANSFLMHYGQPHIQTKLLKKVTFLI